MKIRSWRLVVVGAWLVVLTVAVFQHFISEQGRRPHSSTEQMCGPAVEWVARLETKRRIAHEVLAGRTSLLAAAAAFRRLDDNPPPNSLPRGGILGGASEDERYCRSVIAWVRDEAPPGRAEKVTKRLRVELAAMLRTGAPHLPDVGNAHAAA